MGPLDIILDCMIDTPDRIQSRADICFENSTQYLAINITRDCVYAMGTHMAYLENKNLLRKINKMLNTSVELKKFRKSYLIYDDELCRKL